MRQEMAVSDDSLGWGTKDARLGLFVDKVMEVQQHGVMVWVDWVSERAQNRMLEDWRRQADG